MPFVLDACVTVAWAMKDENDPRAIDAFARIRTDEAWVPAVWWFEVRNVLLMAERRGRLPAAETAVFLTDLIRLSIAIDHAPDEQFMLSVARRHRLTFYDTAYLELAHRRDLPLATLDTALGKAARAEGVALLAA